LRPTRSAVRRPGAGPGFSLIELLVAVTLIAILILPLVSLVSAQLGRDQKLADRETALRVAREVMERALDTGLPSAAVRDDTVRVVMDGRSWLASVDAVDGMGEGEPPGGTDPLEVKVTVYGQNSRAPLASVRALKP